MNIRKFELKIVRVVISKTSLNLLILILIIFYQPKVTPKHFDL